MKQWTKPTVELGEPLWVEILESGMSARLLKEHEVRIKELNIVVPAGFETDFASTPRVLWSIVPPWGRYSPAAVVHDYLYNTAPVSRKEADKAFLAHMEALRVNWLKRKAMYRGVRIGAVFAWNNYRKKEKDKER